MNSRGKRSSTLPSACADRPRPAAPRIARGRPRARPRRAASSQAAAPSMHQPRDDAVHAVERMIVDRVPDVEAAEKRLQPRIIGRGRRQQRRAPPQLAQLRRPGPLLRRLPHQRGGSAPSDCPASAPPARRPRQASPPAAPARRGDPAPTGTWHWRTEDRAAPPGSQSERSPEAKRAARAGLARRLQHGGGIVDAGDVPRRESAPPAVPSNCPGRSQIIERPRSPAAPAPAGRAPGRVRSSAKLR